MTLSLGIVGLPNAGKSTLFNALAHGHAAIAPYPFTTIDPNVGVVHVPDSRLDALAGLIRPERVVPASIEFVDIAGLVRGASKGEGLGNQFLGHIRNVDAIVLVVRCFQDPDVPHVLGDVDPAADAEVLLTELLLADLQTAERRHERLLTPARSGERLAQRELSALQAVEAALGAGRRASTAIDATTEHLESVAGFLTGKPLLVVANLDEDELAAVAAPGESARPDWWTRLRGFAETVGAGVVPVAAKLELELAELDPPDAADYLRSLGVETRGLAGVIRESYRLLDLVTFFTTTGGHEVRAWPVVRGSTAPQAAGSVHTDMERGFIRAEVVQVGDLVSSGSVAAAREHGRVRLEGREYVVRDGDVIHFRFAG